MAEDSFAERTEKATPKRREEARKKGRVARSREIPSALVLLAGLSGLYFSGSFMVQHLRSFMTRSLGQIGTLTLDGAGVQALGYEFVGSLLLILAPVLVAVTGVSLLSNYLQVGGLFAVELVKPDFGRINPLKGFGRLFSKQALVELLKSIFKLTIVGFVVHSTLRNEVVQILLLTGEDPGGLLRFISNVSFSLFLKAGLAILLLSGLDYAFQRWTYEKELRMTKQEMKEEFKQVEGDPLIKSRIRSIQRELARRRMMAEVPKADVVITNPIHLAVALSYRSKEMEAPQVVAKGAGFVAERIKEIARSHGIPILENKPLAQVLFKTVEMGQTIPVALYQAVADVLAYVYRLKGKTL